MQQVSERAALVHEVRAFQVAPVELRDGDEGAPKFSGYASTVEQGYTVRDAFGEFEETMARGAFTRSLKQKDDVRLLVNHAGIPLARTKSKTMRLEETPDLYVEATLDGSNPTVQEVRSAMGRGDLDQMSIGFRVLQQEWNEDYTQRHITEARLFDVSIVTMPANPHTSASLRSLNEVLESMTADVDWSGRPDELRRAIAYLESLLSEEPAATEQRDWSGYYRDLVDLWDKRR